MKPRRQLDLVSLVAWYDNKLVTWNYLEHLQELAVLAGDARQAQRRAHERRCLERGFLRVRALIETLKQQSNPNP